MRLEVRVTKMREYDSYLENRQGKDTSQPNGVSEDPRNEGWGHRSEMEDVDHEKRQSVSQRVNDRRAGGETIHPGKKDHGKSGPDASNDNDDALVGEAKSLKEKYAEKYGN